MLQGPAFGLETTKNQSDASCGGDIRRIHLLSHILQPVTISQVRILGFE